MKIKPITGLVIIFIAIQAIPYGRDHSNPAVKAEPAWDSTQTRSTFFKACADCHSNETTWPWYSHVAPVSWLVQRDVEEGREHFNVSVWGVQKKNEGDEAAEVVQKGEMPLWFYSIPHPEAKLSTEQKTEFFKGLRATFGEESEGEHEEEHKAEHQQ